MDSCLEGSLAAENRARPNRGHYQVVSIDILPDEVLLEIFDFYIDEEDSAADEDLDPFFKKATEAWQLLVHVCRRWRNIVFGAPSGLDLRLVCTTNTPARDTLDVWPALPLCVRCDGHYVCENVDNIIAVLERSDRVVEIELLNVTFMGLETLLPSLKYSFPELTELSITSGELIVPDLPILSLGGSAPCLEFLKLDGIKFAGLPKLLSSTTSLVNLFLKNVPYVGYIPPRVMLTALSTLTCLENLWLGFSEWESQRPALLAHPILPALNYFWFEGFTEYLEDLVAHIDAPQLSYLHTTFSNRIGFDTRQLVQFICRTPMLKALEKASVVLEDDLFTVKFWQPSSLPLHSTSQDLHMDHDHMFEAEYEQQDRQDNTLWLELLQPFTAVKDLYLSGEFAPRIVPALQELIGSGMTVLPILQNIFLEGLQPLGPVQDAIEQFMAARQATSRPITVTRWERKPVKDGE